MKTSLKLQVLWPLAVVLAGVTAVAVVQIAARERTAEDLNETTALSETLERATARIGSRHTLTVRRARGAMTDAEQRVALLAWTSHHYAEEMKRLTHDARRVVSTVRRPNLAESLDADLERLDLQLLEVDRRSEAVAAALDLLLGAASADDPEALTAAATELDRADALLVAALNRANDLIRKASARQLREIGASPLTAPWAVLALLAIAIPVAYWLSTLPLRRLMRLADGQPPLPADDLRSREEQRLGELLGRLREESTSLTALLNERGVDIERAHQATRRADRELALLRLYNENLVNSLRSAIVVTDVGGTVTGFNRAARHLLGMNERLLGKPLQQLPLFRALGEQSPSADDEITSALQGEILRREALPFRRSDTSGEADVLLDLTVVPYLDEGGAARGLLWVSDDVTDAVRVKTQLLSVEHLATVGRLSAQVAHEIRNPLSAIGLNAEMLEDEIGMLAGDGEPSNGERAAEARALVRGIASEVERLSQVTEGYLQLARLPRPECRDADLNQLVSDLFAMLGEEMKAHAVNVELVFGSPPPRAWVDPGQLRQAMLNIVRNSREAMPSGGTLQVRTTANGEASILEFIDDGEGIEPETARRAFEPFYSTKPDGTGLGLSLTEQIMTEHNGSIEIQPAGERGTRVVLSLPHRPASLN